MYQTGCNVYRQTAANTVEDKRMIMLKLYEGMLVFLGCARRGILDNSARIRGENISKVIAIINELECALDHEKGGRIAAQLSSLYQYSTDRLLYASSHNDLEALGLVKQIVVTLKDGFEKAFEEQKREVTSTHVVPPASATATPQRAVQFAV
jgi:flagellar protein FliS